MTRKYQPRCQCTATLGEDGLCIYSYCPFRDKQKRAPRHAPVGVKMVPERLLSLKETTTAARRLGVPMQSSTFLLSPNAARAWRKRRNQERAAKAVV
jgi:hypothetical protein